MSSFFFFPSNLLHARHFKSPVGDPPAILLQNLASPPPSDPSFLLLNLASSLPPLPLLPPSLPPLPPLPSSLPTFSLQVHPQSFMVHKGINPVIDSYSAFFDNKKLSFTEMEAHLRGRGVTDIYVCGIAYDVCVGGSGGSGRGEWQGGGRGRQSHT